MKPLKFIYSYKCDCFQPVNYCNCTYKDKSADDIMKNVTDVAKHIILIMNLCGVSITKRNIIEEIIIYHFLHFEEIIYRIDALPRKRLNKEDLIHDLARKCLMNRRETQMAFSIIKRAFKAFYYGTSYGGVPNNLLKHKITHNSSCLWAHAAQRTAQIYASYNNVFHAFKKHLEVKIKLIYSHLYDRISKNTLEDGDHDCICVNCAKRLSVENMKIVSVTTGMHSKNDPYENAYLQEMKEINYKLKLDSANAKESSNVCNCPSLTVRKMDFAYQENAESTATGDSQGYYYCKWEPISKEKFEEDDANIKLEVPFSDYSICPSCHSEEECETECDCTCEDCTCHLESEIYCEIGEEFDNDGTSKQSAVLNTSKKDDKCNLSISSDSTS